MPSLYHCEQQHAERVASLDAILADAKGRNLTSEERARFDVLTTECVALEKEIEETHNGRVPARPTEDARHVGADRTGEASERRASDPGRMGDVHRQLQAMGMKPRHDPGAGLPPAQASMARTLASMGMTPRNGSH